MERIINFRQLAEHMTNKNGLQIIPNTVFRSGEPGAATESDKKKLHDYRIHDIYDFRSEEEKKSSPQFSELEFHTHSIDLIKEAGTGKNDSYLLKDLSEEKLIQRMTQLYSQGLAKVSNYKLLISDLQSQEYAPFLFHCTAGKDRTGVFGAIFMKILDFAEDEIMEEYLRIDTNAMNQLMKNQMANYHISDMKIMENMRPVFQNRREYLQAYLDSVTEHFGSFDRYLTDYLEVSPAAKDFLKGRYLV
ncbi:MAG: tyrosine-protein phosphatase [Lachnospiraceae bacterium]